MIEFKTLQMNNNGEYMSPKHEADAEVPYLDFDTILDDAQVFGGNAINFFSLSRRAGDRR